MEHKIYVGSCERLKGKTALVRDDPVTCDGGNRGLYLAQFDDMSLEEAFGWRPFEDGEFDYENSSI